MVRILGSFLVPLAIGIFTIVTTIQQYQVSYQNRWKDIEIAARQRDQEQRQADTLQQEIVFAVYIKGMGELSLKIKSENISNTELDQQWKLARAKTLSALRQLDTKRKSYLIQYLYEAELLFADRSTDDLSGSDLFGIILTGRVGFQFLFGHIAFTHVVLTNIFFTDLYLAKANLSESLLNNANFYNAYLFETNFTGCDLINADLRGIQVEFAIMDNVNLSGANFGDIPPEQIKNAILPNGSYVFYSEDNLRSDLFNPSINLIIDGDTECHTNINSTEIFAWEARRKPVAIIKNYSQLASVAENVKIYDCVFWGVAQHNSKDYLHQRLYLYNYSRLIDSGRAVYQFSFDSGGIDAYNNYVIPTLEFRVHNGQSLEILY